ncbi:MAG: hypothetical protein WBC91_20850 [Phototrophicaceae bacterium]
MATTIEYGTYIIDLCTAMLENPGGLTRPQGKRIFVIRKETVNFLTEYLQHESNSLPQLLQYLTHNATSPLEIVMKNCEILMIGRLGKMHTDYYEAVIEILDCCHAMVDDLEDMRQNLDQLMGDLGIA